jgi:hypothetical protein
VNTDGSEPEWMAEENMGASKDEGADDSLGEFLAIGLTEDRSMEEFERVQEHS